MEKRKEFTPGKALPRRGNSIKSHEDGKVSKAIISSKIYARIRVESRLSESHVLCRPACQSAFPCDILNVDL